MYTPVDSPYVSHADGLAIHTAYIEKVRAHSLSRLCAVLLTRKRRLQFWASSVSMYDFLVPTYPRSEL